MQFKRSFICGFLCIYILFVGNTYAADEAKTNPETNPIPEAQRFVSQHKGRFNGQNINYAVTAGETYLRDKNGQETASVFTFAHTKNEQKEQTRLILTVFD
jgi:carboxypeptidase C (cathepsin A)